MNRQDLYNYKYLMIRIKNYKDQYKEKFSEVTNITARLDGMPKAKNKPSYTLEEFIDSSNELIKLYNEDLEKETELFNQLKKMDNELYRTILYLRYIVYPLEKNALELTAAELHRNYNEVCTFNGEALNEFDKLDEITKKT